MKCRVRGATTATPQDARISGRSEVRRRSAPRSRLGRGASSAASPSCPGVLPRHSVDAPTQPRCIASRGLRFRNRLPGALEAAGRRVLHAREGAVAKDASALLACRNTAADASDRRWHQRPQSRLSRPITTLGPVGGEISLRHRHRASRFQAATGPPSHPSATAAACRAFSRSVDRSRSVRLPVPCTSTCASQGGNEARSPW
jgi:hypothetical protein